MLRCFVQCPMDINMEHREATGQRQDRFARGDGVPVATMRLRTIVTCNRCMAGSQGQRTLLEYGLPNTAARLSFGVALRTTTSSESVRRRMREKSRYRP